MSVGELSDEKQQAVAKARDATTELQRRRDLREVMSTPAGRRFVQSMLDDCGVVSGSFTGEALTGAHNEGLRMAGVALWRRCQTEAPEAFVEMFTEALTARMHLIREAEAKALAGLE